MNRTRASGRTVGGLRTLSLQAPAVTLLLLWMIVPLGMTIWFSFQRYNLLMPEMTGFAANVLQHCVRFGDEVGASASLVLRHIHTSLLTPAWLSQNKARRNKSTKRKHRPDADAPNHRVVAAAAASV